MQKAIRVRSKPAAPRRVFWTPDERQKIDAAVVKAVVERKLEPTRLSIVSVLMDDAQNVIEQHRVRKSFSPLEIANWIELVVAAYRPKRKAKIVLAPKHRAEPEVIAENKASTAELNDVTYAVPGFDQSLSIQEMKDLLSTWRAPMSMLREHEATFGSSAIDDAMKWQDHATQPQQITLDIQVTAGPRVEIVQAKSLPTPTKPTVKPTIVVIGVHRHAEEIKRSHPLADLLFIEPHNKEQVIKNKVRGKHVIALEGGVKPGIMRLMRDHATDVHVVNGMATLHGTIDQIVMLTDLSSR